MDIAFTKILETAQLPEYKSSKAAAFDLAAAEAATIAPHTIVRIRTGLVAKIPDGCALLILSRSGTPAKKGLSLPHGIGLIDEDYCGPTDELLIQVYNFTETAVTVDVGERIAQGLIVRVERCTTKEAAFATETSRGGFGSTGST